MWASVKENLVVKNEINYIIKSKKMKNVTVIKIIKTESNHGEIKNRNKWKAEWREKNSHQAFTTVKQIIRNKYITNKMKVGQGKFRSDNGNIP